MNTPSTEERPKETGYYLCEVRRFKSGEGHWVAAEAVMFWDGRSWWEDSIHSSDFDGIFSFQGPMIMANGCEPIRKRSLRRVEYSQ